MRCMILLGSGDCLGLPGCGPRLLGEAVGGGEGGPGGGCGALAVRGGLGAEHAARRQPGGAPQSGKIQKETAFDAQK